MSAERVALWAALHPLEPIEVDCATAVMLKILDGKCKMDGAKRRVMAALYAAVKDSPGALLGADMHRLIALSLSAQSNGTLDEAQRLAIYERRVLAETRIARPAMKAFKARLRAQGLFDGEADDHE